MKASAILLSSTMTSPAAAAKNFVCQLQPHHGKVLRNVINEETRKTLRNKLDAMPSGDTWYGDIYKKAIYGPMVFREPELHPTIEQMVQQVLPGYRILADLYLEKTPMDDGFPFHTDFDSNGFMERPEEMVTLWIPLTPVEEPGSGQLSIVNQEGAIRLSLIRVAHQLHSLVAMMDQSVPRHTSFGMTHPEAEYLEKAKFTPALAAGDALVFCNAFFHKSEPVISGTTGLDGGQKRASYILRCVPKDCQFSRTRLLALKALGQNLAVVNELLKQHYPDAVDPTPSEEGRSAF